MLKSDSAGYLNTYRCFWWSIDFESSRMIICEVFFLLVLNMSFFNNFAESWGLGDISAWLKIDYWKHSLNEYLLNFVLITIYMKCEMIC